MGDLISRTELLDRLNEAEKNINDTYVDDVATRMILTIGRVKIIIKAMPSAERTGKWEMKSDPYGFFDEIPVCSECGCTTKMREKTNYCPNCGCRMKGKKE